MKDVKSFIKSVIGLSTAAIVINGGWRIFVNIFGAKGGWISALTLTGSMWYINHYLGLTKNKENAVFIDMGVVVGLSLITRDIILNGISSLKSSFPTLICVSIGGTPCAPAVITSAVLGPFPPSFHPPSSWCAATAPPHKKSLLNAIINSPFLAVIYL